MTIGTPGYLAPEVLHGADSSPASDVFSLGAVLVYAARGTGPYGTGDPLAIARRSANAEPDLSGLPAQVRALVTPMLQRDPARRPTPAQLLQHVSLSSSVVLHDGLWLPDPVRELLSRRKRELQQALGAVSPAMAGVDPTAAEVPPPVRATLPSDFAALHNSPPPPVQAPAYPARRSSRGFVALLAVGGVLVMGGAIAAVLLLADESDGKSNTASGTGTTHSASVQAGGASEKSSPSASATPSASPTDGASSETSGSDGSDGSGSVLSYQPGTYQVNQQAAVDLFEDTVTLDSVTVAADGSVSVQLTYTDALPGQWTCSEETADEASLQIESDAADVSVSNDCTKDPSKTWYMKTGQTTNGAMYFSRAPEGTGPWTFSLDTEEFQGDVSGISIPTQ
jgi:serine/threonine protein kinase